MDTNFWRQRWKNNEIDFHERDANPQLVKYFKELTLAENSRVFLPLCGKTRDIAWLLSRGYCIAGAELCEIAIEQLFIELEVEPTIVGMGKIKHYSATNIDIFVGNIFDLSSNIIGPVDATYDRAALVALPIELRKQYTAHLIELTNQSPQLLLCYEYEQALMEGPPFSISHEEVNQHYGNSYDLTLLASIAVAGGLKGKCAAKENVWLLP